MYLLQSTFISQERQKDRKDKDGNTQESHSLTFTDWGYVQQVISNVSVDWLEVGQKYLVPVRVLALSWKNWAYLFNILESDKDITAL
jgi:hypothetical protein